MSSPPQACRRGGVDPMIMAPTASSVIRYTEGATSAGDESVMGAHVTSSEDAAMATYKHVANWQVKGWLKGQLTVLRQLRQ
jgi:hypothetical protein